MSSDRRPRSTPELLALLERFVRGGDELVAAVKDLSQGEFLAVPVPGRWSVQQLVVHLYESEIVACDRMRRIAAMERPLLMGFDENAFTARLRAERLDGALAASGLALNRRLLAPILSAFAADDPATFDREGVHSERGIVTLAGILEGDCRHLEHHMTFLREKLAVLGRR
ncbi:MAG TPA: DinB family protein [Phycisphaerales bacterium]|nr:DinB family protein [Phycisphaerales bacterium]HMP37338.1 DinB family protein [Phycisphaerales bacterium]